MKNEQKLSAMDVAAYIVQWFGNKEKDENDLTPLKLQKLLYYCQGHYLAWANVPLFEDKIEAWPHGPVVPGVYLAYKDCGAKVIKKANEGSSAKLNNQQKDIVNQVLEIRGQYSAWRLRQMTHDEEPWKFASKNKEEISHESMNNYFKQFIR